MRVFPRPNKKYGWRCPICNTDEDGEVVLIRIAGTEDGNNAEAEQVHLDCLDLVWDRENGIIFQILKREVKNETSNNKKD